MSETTTARRIPGAWNIPYQYTIGTFASAFFEALGEGRILGSKCAECGQVSVPPKSFCEACFLPVHETVEVGSAGVIEAVTVVTAPFAGSPPVPYAVAYVRLDGATSAIANYVRDVDLSDVTTLPSPLRLGARVSVVFGDQPEGKVTDFWFVPATTTGSR
jgi:uncharacterized OB-fold protein